MKKQKHNNSLDYLLLGIFLGSIALGSIYSITLTRFSLYHLMFITIILFFYFQASFTSWHRNIRVSQSTQIVGLIGITLLLIFFGMQSPQIPFKSWILAAGIILIFWGIFSQFKNR